MYVGMSVCRYVGMYVCMYGCMYVKRVRRIEEVVNQKTLERQR